MNGDILGHVLSNRYELLEHVGYGGMAHVYRALDRNTKKMVAVKILREELTHDEAFVARFEQEAAAASRMTHPNVVNLLDVGVEGGLRFLVIEFISGTSLKDLIRRDGALRSDMAANIAIRILNALAHAHGNGIIHRDIKPQNILLDKQNVIKVLDFGIARVVGQPGSPDTKESAIGSVHYFSPEQARGELADEKSDIYSVGVVLYEMLTGRKPFDGDNQVAVAMAHLDDDPVSPASINPNIPAALSQVVMRAMEKEPEERYSSADAMIRAIRQAMRFPNITPLADTKREPMETHGQIVGKQRRLRFWRRVMTTCFTVMLSAVVILLIASVTRNVLRTMLNRVIMPVVTNKNFESAAEELESHGLIVHRVERTVEVGSEGRVVEQSPDAGTLLMPGDEVLLTVSIAQSDLLMPDLVRHMLAEAQETIRTNKLVLLMTETVASEAREGMVVEQIPMSGAKVKFGQTVILKVSGGLVIVPNFIGMSENDAMSGVPSTMSLTEVRLQTVNDSQLNGVVIAQEPRAYERSVLGQSLVLIVGRLETRIYTGEVKLPVSLEYDALVKVMLVQNDGTEELQYCAIHPEGESEARFLVRADLPGEYQCKLYEEDQYVRTISVELK